MARLPFLVEHGPIVWQGLAAIAAGVAIGVARRARARREQRRTARELAARAADTTAPVEGRATVRGTLRGGSAASVALLHLRGPRPYYDERAPELWLDCDGQRVALDGAIRVVCGSRVVSTRDRRSAVPDDELAVRSSPILHRLPALAVSVRDGDDVFVTARLVPRPGAEVRGYREAATVWTASPDAGASGHANGGANGDANGDANGGTIEVVAAAPVIRAIPLGRTRSAALGAAAAALATAALWITGATALGWARTTGSAAGHLVPDQLGELEPLSLAAATPGHRDEALAAIEAGFATRFQRTPDAFARWRAVARLRAGCGGELEARIAQGEIDGLDELARDCNDDRAAVSAYQLLGLFREAAERDAELPAGEQHIESLIAIGAWQRAGWWAGTQHDRASVRSPASFACAEQWFRWLAGFVPASEARSRFPQDDPGCKVIAALLLPDRERNAALIAASSDPEVEAMADALAWASGTPHHVEAIIPTGRVALHRAMFDPGDRTTISRALLSGPALDRADDAMGSQGTSATQAWRAVREMLSGHLPRARTHAMTAPRVPAVAEFAAHEFPVGTYSQALDVAFALRAAAPLPALSPQRRPWRIERSEMGGGDPAGSAGGAGGKAPRGIDPPGLIADPDVLWQRYQAMYWGALVDRQTCDRPDLGPASDLKSITLRAARSGDGRELAEHLAMCRLDDTAAIEAAFAVWPRLRAGRDRLAGVLRTIDLGSPATDPLVAIGHAAMRRDLARLTGDAPRAAAWQAIVERHLQAFSSYTALTALMVRELVRAADRDGR